VDYDADGTLERVVRSVVPFHLAVSWISIAVVIVAFLWNRRSGRQTRHDNDLIAFLMLFMVVNAFVCASLNTVIDRYQSRMIWLVTLAAAIAVTRWYVERPGARRSGA